MKNLNTFDEFVNESLNEKKFDHVKNAKIVHDVWNKIVGDGLKGIQLKHIGTGGKQQSQFVFTDIEGVRTPDSKLDKFAKEVEKVLKKTGLKYDVNRNLGIVDIFETILLPINELTFNDQNGNPSKISKEIAKIIEKALPSNVSKRS